MSSFAEKLPFWHFDDSLMVFSDGSVGAGFRLQGKDISCADNEEINTFARQIEDLLLSAEEGLSFQLFYKLSSNVGRTISAHGELSKDAPKVYQPVREARLKFFNENAQSGAYFVPEIFFYIRGKSFDYKKGGLFEKQSDFQRTSTTDYLEHKKGFIRSLKKVEASLRAAKVEPSRLDRQEWFDNVFEYLNFSRSENVGFAEYRPPSDMFAPSLNSQLNLSDVRVDSDGLKVDKYHFQVVTLKSLPLGQTFASMIDGFTKLPFHYWVCQNIRTLNQSAELKKLQLQRRIARSMAAGSENVSDIESESKFEQVEGLLTELMNGTEKLVEMDFNVVIWGKDKEELEEKADEVLRAMRGLGQAEGIVESLPAEEAFLGSIPGGAKGLRFKKMKSSNAAHLLPLYSSWVGNRRPVCLLPDRQASLVGVDIFANELQSWNGIFFGSSGAGKSFNISQLMLGFSGLVEKNGKSPRIVWIDNGASSQRLLEVLDGEFMDLSLSSGICINMFDLEKGETTPSAARIKVILTVLERILKDDDKQGLPKRMKALLEEAIYDTYRKAEGRTPTLSDLKEILKNHRVEEMRFFSDILYSWTGETAYGAMLDGRTNVELSKNLVTIEVQLTEPHNLAHLLSKG